MSCLLTRILKEACGGNSRTCIILAVSQSEKDFRPTQQAFQFGQSAQVVKNFPKVNVLAVEAHATSDEDELDLAQPSAGDDGDSAAPSLLAASRRPRYLC